MKRSLVPVLASVLAILAALPAMADSAAPAVAVSSTGRPYNAGQAQSTNPTSGVNEATSGRFGAVNSVSPVNETKVTPAIDESPMSTLSGTCSQMSLGDNASLNGFVPFPSTYAWNTNISSAPLDSNNAAITSAAGFAGLHLHHDFSSVAGGNYGIPYVVVDSSSTPLVPINVIDYAEESDVALAPFPLTAPIEGAPADCDGWPDTYIGDSHVLVLDRNACMLYETFNTHRCNGAWNASSETIWNLQSSEQRPWGWTSADAAGLAIFPGLVRYDEVAAGAINHAIRFTMQQTKNDANDGYFVEPASHAAGTVWGVSNVMGMRIRLKASFNISGYSAANQVILTAMKKYGMILADNGGYFYFQGVPDPRWDDDDLLNLDTIQSSNFEVVQMTPAFPGYDAGTAPTGQPPTIDSFTASASTVVTGTPVTLTWNTSNDSYDFIDVLGGVRGGSVTTTPITTTTYTLNATNQYGRSTVQVTVKVSQTILSQTITFGTLSNQQFGAAPFTVSATASSGLPVSFNSQTTSVCTVSGSQVTLIAVGTCTVQATQAGNTSYAAAAPVNQSFQVMLGGPVTLTVTIVGNGTVTPNPPPSNGSYADGTQVCLTPTPATGWLFGAWSGAILDASNCLFVNGNTSVAAYFVTTTAEFSDVPPTASYFDAADLMFLAGVTTGCVPSSFPQTREFCPNDDVTREEMAAFIVRAVTGTVTPAIYNPTPYFQDVPNTNPFFPHIQKLMDLGITTGCSQSPSLFCPTNTIPRWEMAMFLVRARLALYGATFSYNPTPYFADVPTNVEGNGMPFPFIQRSYDEHITTGCGTNPLTYCPDDLATRGEMASFIMRGLFNETMVIGPTAPYLTAVTPNAVSQTSGSQITVTITGANTNFQTGDTVTVPSGMLAVSNIVVNSAISISSTLTVNANAVAGPQALVVSTGGQNITLPLPIKVGIY